MSTIEKKMIMNTKETDEREKREYRISECVRLAREYGHSAERTGVACFVDESNYQKAKLKNILSKSPLWDNRNDWIEVDVEVVRNFDAKTTNDFICWVEKKLYDYCYNNRLKVGLFDYSEYAANLRCLCSVSSRFCGGIQMINGRTRSEVEEDIARMRKRISAMTGCELYLNGNYITLPCEEYKKAKALLDLLWAIKIEETATITQEDVDKYQLFANDLGLKAKISVGMKKTRLVQKACQIFGITEIKEMVDASYFDNSGVFHEKKRDKGWNYQFAKFADAITPKFFKKKMRFSINHMDYLTMSFGTNWASCQTIDVNNYRRMENSYHGQYCSGTVGLALDEVTLVAYIVGNEEKYGEYSKEKRCLFSFGEDKLIQHRVYPDGRDGGCGIDYAAAFRQTLQDIIAECLGYDNVWKFSNGVSCDSYRKFGTHYNDLTCGDCTISYMVDKNGNKNFERIDIGCDPICFVTGDNHETEGSLCDENVYTCEWCEANLNRDYAIVAESRYGDVYFCDDYCAEHAGYVLCEYGEYHYETDCWQDAYTQDWHYSQDPVVETEDGLKFLTCDNAYNYGYVYVEKEYGWYLDSETVYDDQDGNYYLISDDIITVGDFVGDLHFGSSENAIAYGCVYNEETEEWEVA